MSTVKAVNVLGVPVRAHTMDTLIPHLEELIARPGCAAAYGVNAHALNLTYRHQDYLEALRRADLVYADGASLRAAGWVLGGCIPEKLTTTDVWPPFCRVALENGYKFFLLGGEEGLAERAGAKAIEIYPGLQIVGTHHGFFKLGDEKVVEIINEAGPDVLWVGMGDPRQAIWTEAVKKRLGVPLVITCGGMFKVVTGELKRVSAKWRRRGFEWFFRMFQEPKTWRRYIIGLPAFALRVLAQRLFGHRAKSAGNS